MKKPFWGGRYQPAAGRRPSLESVSLRAPRVALLCVLAFLVWAGHVSLRSSSSGTAPPPLSPRSVVLITLDTVRADHLGCYGYRRIETPSIDKLAQEGIRFEHAYAQVPLTLPSHTALMTGTYPMFNGVRDLTSTGVNSTLPTLAEIMRRNGYRTAAFVSSFVLNSIWGLNRGFEIYDDGTDPGSSYNPSLLERRGDRTMARALAWLDSHSDRPFLLWVHLYDPHSPYRAPEPYFSRYAGHPYDGEIAFDDAQLARLFARLRELKLYESALIVVASDHGESLGQHSEAEHGFFLYNATLHVPLILKLPGPARSRAVSDPVELVEIAPTIANLCRIPQQFIKTFQTGPLAGMQEGKSTDSDPPAYAESYHPLNTFGWHELRSVITSKYQFIDAPRPELYDLDRDLEERHNLAAEQSAICTALRNELQTMERRYANKNTNPPRNPNPLDSEASKKLRSLGYVADRAPAGETDSRGAVRADPKDKIQVFNQILHAGDLRSQKQFAESDAILTALERSEPTLYIIAFERGETLLNWGKAKESTVEFRKALALNPSFDEAWMGLGRADFEIGQNKEAIQALRAALRYNPRNYSTRRLLARVYWRENQPDQAEAELARVVTEHPDFAEGRAEHGVALVKLKRYRDAITELRAASSLGCRDAVMYYHLGLSYSETGDVRRAIEAYQQAVEVDPSYAVAYLRLAHRYRKSGESSKARQYYQKACKLSEEICRDFTGQF